MQLFGINSDRVVFRLVGNYCKQAWSCMKIRSIASALLLLALVLNSCTNQNTEVKVGSSPSTSADTDVKPNSSPTTLAISKLFLFTRNGKYGYIDRTGKIVIPAKLDTPYENSNSVTSDRDELISFAQEDHFGNIRYEFAYRLGLYGPKPRVEGDYFHGYKDRRTGKVIISPQFRHAADRFSDGLAWIMDERHRVGYIDKQGKIVIPLQYSYSSSQCTHYCASTAYFGSDFNGGLAKVCSGELRGSRKCGYIDRTGKVVIPLKFDEVAEKFSNSLASVVINERLGYIDKTGKIVITLHQSYSEADDFDGGLARVCSAGKSRKCGYIDRTGKVVIPLKFDEVAKKFSNGLAWVVINERLGYIDKTGKVKIPIKFTYPLTGRPAYPKRDEVEICNGKCVNPKTDFDRGLAAVKIPKTCGTSDENDCDRFGYIDTTGKLVFEF
jgi:WG containing repeat